jgi:hypothetical protein
MIELVRIRVDEAGDFNYRDRSRLWVSVVAGIVIPDNSWAAVEAFATERRRRWDMPELKAADMNDAQLMDVARFIIAENLTAAAIATDSRIFTADAQREWRERQVAVFRASAARSRRAVEDEHVKERVARLRRRMHQLRHVSQPNFLQYAVLMPSLLAHLISAALLTYSTLSVTDEGWLIDVLMDERPGADPGKAGDVLRDSVEAILASDDRTALRMPAEWPADHPFKVKNRDPEIAAVSARQVLAGGLKSGRSDADAGLQLADFVAHLILTLLRDPDDRGAMLAWTALVRAPRVMPTEEGWPIKAWAWPAEDVADEDMQRYERLVPSRP